MKNTPQSGITAVTSRLLSLGLLALALLAAAGPLGAESAPLVLDEGDSRLMKFSRMQRVATVDPQIVDVVVTGLNELLVLGRNAGRTKLYVWDSQGRHEYAVVVRPVPQAQEAARRLRALLPPGVSYEVLDEHTLVLEGQVPTDQEIRRVEQIVQGVAAGVRVVNLVMLQDADLTPAQRQARALERILGGQFQYVIWDPGTVMVMGQVPSEAELQQLQKLVEAGSTGGVQVANLVTVGSPTGEPPTAAIQQAIGPEYRVWPLLGRTVVVEGSARDAAGQERVSRLLEAFAAQAQIVNLVRVATTGALPLAEQRDLVQAALGEDLRVRMVADQALVVEGAVPDEASLKRVTDVLALFSPDTRVRSLVRMVDPAKQQIMVRVRVLDIRIAEMQRLGIAWGDLAGGDLRVPNYSWVFEVADFDHADNIYSLGARLSVLEDDNAALVLVLSNLLIIDGEKADIHVGGEIPIPVPSVGPTGTVVTIEYKPYGVQLDIEPQITPDGRIRLKLTPEVSAIDPAQSVVISGLSIPAFRTRRTTTTVDVQDGGTLAIGGLIQHEQSRVVNRIPFLSSLPIIGELFKHREWQEGKTELVVLVSPVIVTDQPPREGIPPLGDTELPPG